ncbi:hypothetical protein D3C80_1577090 [compost metagenome]
MHRIAAGRALDIAEGGFALGQEAQRGQFISPAGAAACTAWGATAIKGLLGYAGPAGKAELIMPNANTNLLRPRTVLPTLTASLEPGVHWLVSAVYGDPEANPSMDSWSRQAAAILEQQPESRLHVGIEQQTITVLTADSHNILIRMD